jgi:hypothetical protein
MDEKYLPWLVIGALGYLFLKGDHHQHQVEMPSGPPPYQPNPGAQQTGGAVGDGVGGVITDGIDILSRLKDLSGTIGGAAGQDDSTP